MPSESPSLSLAIARLNPPEANHFATWVVDSPLPSGYVHHDCILPESLSQLWQAWLEMFSPESASPSLGDAAAQLTLPPASPDLDPKPSYSSRLMQHLGIHLWQWLFQGSIQNSFHRSQGIALGLESPLRVRLDVRDADLIPLPWEIMQPQPGQPAISLNQRLLFSRTTCDVHPLSDRQVAESLNILLVLGHNEVPPSQPAGTAIEFLPDNFPLLELEGEAEELTRVLAGTPPSSDTGPDDRVPCFVNTLIRPSVAELIAELESRRESGKTPYNVLFYGGHGIPAPDGGQLFLQADTAINGTELAQVLVRCGITLAVFNACWSAQPAREQTPEVPSLAIPGSSLAKVLIHHGVPAVLGMRDSITDEEALSFIQVFARALSARMPIDRAVALARQHLLALFKFNQPAWTLPVLYMHPEFDGQLIEPADEIRTELPANSPTGLGYAVPRAGLRLHVPPLPPQMWPVEGGMVRVGRGEENDIVLRERWVSSKHAEIFCRNGDPETREEPTYFLRDFSRYGTLVFEGRDWQRVHHQEVALRSGTQLKFGSSQGQVLEFVIETPPAAP